MLSDRAVLLGLLRRMPEEDALDVVDQWVRESGNARVLRNDLIELVKTDEEE